MQKNPFAQQYPISPAPWNCQKRPWTHLPQWRRGWSQEGQREGQELDNIMCCHHVKSEPRTQTFSLHVRPSPGLCCGLRKTAVALVVRRARNGAFVRRYRWISCVRTEVYMFSCLFVHICLHMTYTNVILCNMRITWWSAWTSLKQDGVSNDPGDVLISQQYTWTCVSTHKSHPNNPTNSLFVGSPQRQWGRSFTLSAGHRGFGRVCNMKVCALGSDMM
jgi:hypothetical protein